MAAQWVWVPDEREAWVRRQVELDHAESKDQLACNEELLQDSEVVLSDLASLSHLHEASVLENLRRAFRVLRLGEGFRAPLAMAPPAVAPPTSVQPAAPPAKAHRG